MSESIAPSHHTAIYTVPHRIYIEIEVNDPPRMGGIRSMFSTIRGYENLNVGIAQLGPSTMEDKFLFVMFSITNIYSSWMNDLTLRGRLDGV